MPHDDELSTTPQVQAARPSLMRALNEQMLLEQMRRFESVSRSDLTAVSGLSKPAVAIALATLEGEGLIQVAGRISGRRGRATTLYQLRPEVVKALQGNYPDENAKVQALAGQVARDSMLTIDVATLLVKEALTRGTSSADAARQISARLLGLTGPVDLELSKPNPLSKFMRTVFAAALAAIVIVSVVLVAVAHVGGMAEYVGLGVLGGLSCLGAVLFVLGYQNVTVKGSTGSNPPSRKDM